MSGKLDQSLAEITSTSRRVGGRRTQRRSAIRAKAAIAPSAGVKKTIKPARKSGAKTALIPTGPAKGDSKVIVSNLVSPTNLASDHGLMIRSPRM